MGYLWNGYNENDSQLARGRAVDTASLPSYGADKTVALNVNKATGNQLIEIYGSIDITALSYLVDSIAAFKGLSTSLTTAADLVCAVAGTAIQGSSVATVNGIIIVAYPTNTGTIYIGGSNVSNSSGTRRGIILTQGGMASEIIPVSNLNLLWINADNNSDGAGVLVL